MCITAIRVYAEAFNKATRRPRRDLREADVIGHLVTPGVQPGQFGWQTAGWSAGRVSAQAHLYQRLGHRGRHRADRNVGRRVAPWMGQRLAPAPVITEPATLRAVAEQAGLDVVRVDRVACRFDYADEEELLGSVFDSALSRAVGRRAGPVAVREAVLERLEPYRTAAGPIG